MPICNSDFWPPTFLKVRQGSAQNTVCRPSSSFASRDASTLAHAPPLLVVVSLLQERQSGPHAVEEQATRRGIRNATPGPVFFAASHSILPITADSQLAERFPQRLPDIGLI